MEEFIVTATLNTKMKEKIGLGITIFGFILMVSMPMSAFIFGYGNTPISKTEMFVLFSGAVGVLSGMLISTWGRPNVKF